jgi:hypothetical protein
MTQIATLILTQREAVSFSAHGATEGEHRTLPYPPGSALLGHAAARLVPGRSDPAGWISPLFIEGGVRFSDALPLDVDGVPGYPMPRSLRHEKGKPPKERLGADILAGTATGEDQAAAGGKAYEAFKSGSVTLGGVLVKPERTRRLRTATKDGRADTGRLFEAEIILPGNSPRYAATLEADDGVLTNDEWNELLAVFTGTLRLGRSAHAAYGGAFDCAAATAGPDIWAPPCNAKANPDRTILWALSDIALVDDGGMPVFAPEGEAIGLPGLRLDARASAVTMRRYAPWNAHLGRRDIERAVIEAGSVLVYEGAVEPAKTSHRAGLHQAAGLGRFAVNPAFLDGNRGVAPQLATAPARFGNAAAAALVRIGGADAALGAWLDDRPEAA